MRSSYHYLDVKTLDVKGQMMPNAIGKTSQRRDFRHAHDFGLDDARRSVSALGTAPRGLLRVLVEDTLADRAIAPLVPLLLREHPDLRLELVRAWGRRPTVARPERRVLEHPWSKPLQLTVANRTGLAKPARAARFLHGLPLALSRFVD
jgi:hypothetical protein